MSVRALWDPGWYNLDQSLKVGERRRFAFHPLLPLPEDGDDHQLVFAASTSAGVEWDHRQATVGAVEHPRLGGLDEVDASQFGEYTFRFLDGRWVTIEAEQDPGCVNAASPGFPVETCDPSWALSSGWALTVTLSDVEQPPRRHENAEARRQRRRAQDHIRRRRAGR